jgi:hypothetical protein
MDIYGKWRFLNSKLVRLLFVSVFPL